MISDRKIVFFGTPDYVIPVLDALKSAGYEIVAVVTQPPKPVGRKKILTPSPVAQWAKQNGIEVIDKSPKEIVPLLTSHHPQIGTLAAYGRIIPQDTIDVFPHGIINIHPSLLPKYRGASPIEATLVIGEKQTGVTIIKLDAEMDHGPIVAQTAVDIKETDTRVTLRERLFEKGAETLVEILPSYLDGRIELREQNHQAATFTALMKKDHGAIPGKYLEAAMRGETVNEKWQIPFIKDFTVHPSPVTIHNFLRALNPWPGAFTSVKLKVKSAKLEKKLKILKAHIEEHLAPQQPSAPATRLVLDLVQLEGKKPVSWEQFKKGYPDTEFA